MFTIDDRIARLSAPPSLPLNNELRLPIAMGRMERSTVLEFNLDAAVAEEQRQALPVIEHIVDGLCQLRLEEWADHLGQSRFERLRQRYGSGTAGGQPLLRTAAADLCLDGIDGLQAFDYLVRERRARRLVDLDKFASRMGETESELDRAAMAAGERLVGGIAVHLQNPGVARQLSSDRVGAAPVGKHIGDRRRRRTAPRAIVHRMRPELADPGAASPRVEHRHRNIVAKHSRCCLNCPQLEVIQAFEPPGRTLHPARERRPVEMDAGRGICTCRYSGRYQANFETTT